MSPTTLNPDSGPQPARMFFWVGLAAGLFLVFWLPPFQAADEYAHLLRAWQVAQGDWLPHQVDCRVGGVLPADLSHPTFAPFWQTPFHADRRITPAIIRAARAAPLAAEPRAFFDFVNTAVTASPLTYLPQAAGIRLGWLAGGGVIDASYAGRAVNLLVWLALVRLAIHWMPLQKWTMATIALSPACLVQACSLSTDATTTALAFLFTAGAVRLTWPPEPPLTGRRFVLLLALAAALALTKITYGLLAFLVLGLCARSGPGATADKWRGVATLIGAGAAAAVWAGYAQSIYLDYAHYHPAFRDGQALIPGADPAAQWRHLRAAPGDFLAAVWALRGAFGTVYSTFGSLGWDMAASWQIGGMIPIGILLLALWDGNARWPIAWWQRLLALVVAGAVISAIFLVCYLQWTVVGARNIAGLQGRYFLPLLPALLLALARPGRELPLKARRIIPLFWLGMVALTAAVIARRYYAPV